MTSGADSKRLGWNGDGTGTNGNVAKQIANMPGIVQDQTGTLHFAEWNCRAGQNNVIIRTDGTVAPCFPMYGATYDWGSIDGHKFDPVQLQGMKKTCQQHCFSTLNHNLAYCYNDARVIKFVWTNLVTNRARGGARSFEDWRGSKDKVAA
jgi:radical SAM protein with 4Fe4S-binding SPASM domain